MIRKTRYFWIGALGLLSLDSGCVRHELTLADVDYRMAIAVSPALNHSGSQDFDPLRLADLMASELAQLPGVRVIPLNRVLAQLAAENKERIESPEHALQVMERVGADGIVVFAVTEYDPYHPPVMGLTAQLYGIGPELAGGFDPTRGFDPVAASRQASPFEGGANSELPRAEYHRVFNSSDEAVQREIRRFALRRNAEDSPYGWRKFVASQENFWRFCCAVTTRELIRQEVTQVVALRERNNEVEQP